MSTLRNEAIKLIDAMPEESLKSIVGILQNVQELTKKEEVAKKERVDWKKIIEKYSGSASCFKDIDVEAYIRESRGYDRI